MKKFKIYIIILFVLLILSQETFAGGWTLKQGRVYFQISSQIVNTDQFRDAQGLKLTIPKLEDYTVSFYSEYGITNDLTAIVYLPFYRNITLNRNEENIPGYENFPGDSNSGISDFDIGLRYKLFTLGQTVISSGLMFGIPAGDSKQPNGLLTGDGEFNQYLSVQAGHSFYPLPIFTSASFGFNNRTKGYSDELRYSAEAGYNVTKDFLVILKAYGVETLKNGDSNVKGGNAGLYPNDQRYLAYGPVLFYSITENYGITASVFSGSRLRNIAAGHAYGFGFYFKN